MTRFALRLPAAISAFALLAVVFCWGRSLAGFEGGAVAGLLLLQMAQFWSLGRRGVAEMPLALFTTGALLCFDRVYWSGRRKLVPLFFLLALLAFLAKATTALLVIGLPILIQLRVDRTLRRALRRDVLAWAALCACASLAWYVAVLVLVPGAWPVLHEALLLPLGLSAAIDSAAHVKPFWFYLPQLVAVASPAFLVAPVLCTRASATSMLAEPRTRFLLLAFASLLLAFSLIPMKQKHYTMPLLPLLAVLLSEGLRRVYQRRRNDLLRWIEGLGVVVLAASPLVSLAVAVHLYIAGEGPAWISAAVAATLVLTAILAAAAGRSGSLRVFAASSLLATATIFAIYSSSLSVWRDRFKAGAAATADLDSGRFEQVFTRYPLLRQVYGAREWRPDSVTVRDRTE